MKQVLTYQKAFALRLQFQLLEQQADSRLNGSFRLINCFSFGSSSHGFIHLEKKIGLLIVKLSYIRELKK